MSKSIFYLVKKYYFHVNKCFFNVIVTSSCICILPCQKDYFHVNKCFSDVIVTFSKTTKFLDSCLPFVFVVHVSSCLVLWTGWSYSLSRCIMCRGVSCVVLWSFYLYLAFFSVHLYLSFLSLHALLALYLLSLISIPSPVSFFFVLSCLVLRLVLLHVLSLSLLSLLHSI